MDKRVKYRISRHEKFRKDIKDLNDEISVLESLKKDLVESCKELFPLQEGTIFMYGDAIYRFLNLNSVEIRNDIIYRIYVQFPSRGFSKMDWTAKDKYGDDMNVFISHSNLNKIKILKLDIESDKVQK